MASSALKPTLPAVPDHHEPLRIRFACYVFLKETPAMRVAQQREKLGVTSPAFGWRCCRVPAGNTPDRRRLRVW
jgi:hypothetical protein